MGDWMHESQNGTLLERYFLISQQQEPPPPLPSRTSSRLDQQVKVYLQKQSSAERDETGEQAERRITGHTGHYGTGLPFCTYHLL